jgi:hypothetical protein
VNGCTLAEALVRWIVADVEPLTVAGMELRVGANVYSDKTLKPLTRWVVQAEGHIFHKGEQKKLVFAKMSAIDLLAWLERLAASGTNLQDHQPTTVGVDPQSFRIANFLEALRLRAGGASS